MINKTWHIGRITKDLELRFSPNGNAVCKFSLAVNREYNKDETDFINFTAFGKQAENLCNYMQKGSLIAVVGRIQTGSYENGEGKKIYTTDVIADSIQFLEKKDNDVSNQPGPIKVQEQFEEDMLPF